MYAAEASVSPTVSAGPDVTLSENGVDDAPPGLLQEARGAMTTGSWEAIRAMGRSLSPLLSAFLLGSTLGAAVLAGIAYRVALVTIVAHRRHQALKHAHNPDRPGN